jgi:hypothetical protein
MYSFESVRSSLFWERKIINLFCMSIWCCNQILLVSSGHCPGDWSATVIQTWHISSGVNMESWCDKYFGCLSVWWKYGGLWIEAVWSWYQYSATCCPSNVSILASSYYVFFVKYVLNECIIRRLCPFDHIFLFPKLLDRFLCSLTFRSTLVKWI